MPCTDGFRDEFQQTCEGDNSKPGVEKEGTFHDSFYEAK